MNIKLRLKNKATLAALIAAIVVFVYQVCGVFGVVPPVAQGTVEQLVGLVLNMLVALGVLVDPTTQGIGDSEQAKTYTNPKED